MKNVTRCSQLAILFGTVCLLTYELLHDTAGIAFLRQKLFGFENLNPEVSNILSNELIRISDIGEEINRVKTNLTKQIELLEEKLRASKEMPKPGLNRKFDHSRIAFMNVIDKKGRDYIMGILVQHMLLKKFGSNIRHIVAYTNHFSGIDVLDRYGIDRLHVGLQGAEIQRTIANCGKCRYGDFNKIAAFNLSDKFDKIIVLDCDIMPLGNLDHMFVYPGPFAASFEPDRLEFNTGVFILEPSREL